MQSGAAVPAEQIEASLQSAIKLNPRFAPAYDALAMFYGMHHEKLDEAHMMNLRAAALDPANLGFRMNTAVILQEEDRYKDAIPVLKSSAGLAKTPEEATNLDTRIKQLEEYQAQHAPAEAATNPHDRSTPGTLPRRRRRRPSAFQRRSIPLRRRLAPSRLLRA